MDSMIKINYLLDLELTENSVIVVTDNNLILEARVGEVIKFQHVIVKEVSKIMMYILMVLIRILMGWFSKIKKIMEVH